MSDKTNALLVNHNDILIAKYVSIGDGWVDIVDNALNEMRQIDPSVEVNTVKEKFGALRMYFRGPSGNVTELNKVVEEAAEAASMTCDVCGDMHSHVDTIFDGGWVRTRCPAHANTRN